MSRNDLLKPVAPQESPYQSPWSFSTRVMRLVFNAFWMVFCRFTPNPLNFWRLAVLRMFGAKISGRPYVAPSAKIWTPWNVTIEDHACIGPGAELYALGKIILRERCTVSQHSYICTGSHDLTQEALPLLIGTVEIGADAYLFAYAFVSPGVTIGEGTVIGARSVVTKNMPDWTICVGNPCRPIKPREFPRAPAAPTSVE